MITRRGLAALLPAALIRPRKKGRPAVGWASSIFPLLITYSTSGGVTGYFSYVPSPGAGNLLLSITESATDPYGNKTIPSALTVYNPSASQAVAYGSNGMTLYTGSFTAGWTGAGVSVNLGSNGVSVIGPMNFEEGSVPSPNSAGPWIFGNDAGHMQVVSDSTNGDSNTYDIERLTFVATGGQAVNSTGTSVVTGTPGTIHVAAGETYRVSGMVVVEQGATAASQAIRFSGTATMTSFAVGWQCIEGNTIFDSGVATALNSDLGTGAVTASTTGELRFEGVFTVDTAGTFDLLARCVTSGADPWTVGFGTYFDLGPVG